MCIRDRTCEVRSPWGLEGDGEPPPGGSGGGAVKQNYFEKYLLQISKRRRSTPGKEVG